MVGGDPKTTLPLQTPLGLAEAGGEAEGLALRANGEPPPRDEGGRGVGEEPGTSSNPKPSMPSSGGGGGFFPGS